MRVAILSRPDNRSPKILAMGLQDMLGQIGVECEIIYDAPGLLMRLFSLSTPLRSPLKLHYRLRRKLRFLYKDTLLLKKLRSFDVVVLSECIPNAFWKGYYDIEGLRKKIGKPVVLYEVYYIGNSDKQLLSLQANGDHGIKRFDWHFSVSPTTEVTGVPGTALQWTNIGLNITYTGLAPVEKKEFMVLVDFAQPGFEKERAEQLAVLQELNIPYVELKGQYSFEEIRALYKKASVLLVQFPEAFGLPIAECLSTGAYVMLPNEFWAMSWRLKGSDGNYFLPSCFVTYQNDKLVMKEKLLSLMKDYDPVGTPARIFEVYTQYYREFYYGDVAALQEALTSIQLR